MPETIESKEDGGAKDSPILFDILVSVGKLEGSPKGKRGVTAEMVSEARGLLKGSPFYAEWIDSKNLRWVSNTLVKAGDVEQLLKFIRTYSPSRRIHVITGTHGDAFGATAQSDSESVNFDFLLEDTSLKQASSGNVSIGVLFPGKPYEERPDTDIIQAWCYSEMADITRVTLGESELPAAVKAFYDKLNQATAAWLKTLNAYPQIIASSIAALHEKINRSIQEFHDQINRDYNQARDLSHALERQLGEAKNKCRSDIVNKINEIKSRLGGLGVGHPEYERLLNEYKSLEENMDLAIKEDPEVVKKLIKLEDSRVNAAKIHEMHTLKPTGDDIYRNKSEIVTQRNMLRDINNELAGLGGTPPIQKLMKVVSMFSVYASKAEVRTEAYRRGGGLRSGGGS